MKKSSGRCLILGGCGFLGSYAVEALLKAGYRIRVFDKVYVNTANIAPFINEIELYHGDLSNRMDIENATKGIDYVFHFAGTTNPETATESPVFDLESNVVGTVNFLEIARKRNFKKIIYSSSGGTIYGFPKKLPIPETHFTDPISAYGISKLINEKYLQMYYYLYGLNYIILRFANPYGPRQNLNNSQGAIVHFLHSIYNHKKVEVWGNGSIVRDYFFVKDLIPLFPKLLSGNLNNKVFNIGRGKGYSINEVLKITKSVLSIDFETVYSTSRKIDLPINYLFVKKVKDELNWVATTDLGKGILETWRWIESIGSKKE